MVVVVFLFLNLIKESVVTVQWVPSGASRVNSFCQLLHGIVTAPFATHHIIVYVFFLVFEIHPGRLMWHTPP